MSNLVFSLPTENVAADATPTVDIGTEDPDYPAEFLVDMLPQKPAKLLEATGAWKWDFGTAKSIELVAIPHHNLTAGIDVRLQANATDAWTTPSLDVPFVIAAYMEDGFPYGAFLDISAISHSYRYWRIKVAGTNSAPIAIGEIWMGSVKHSMTINIHWGLAEEEEALGLRKRTSHGVISSFPFGVRPRRIAGEVETTATGLAQLNTWYRSTGFDKCLVIPDPAVNNAMMMHWSEMRLSKKLNFTNSNLVQLAWDEASRGLYL